MICVTCLLLFNSCKSHKQVEVVEDPSLFQYDSTTSVKFIEPTVLSEVLNHAKEEGGKLTFVKFYTDWCLPCQIMDETVFVNKTLGNYYNENFINYKVNAEEMEGPDLRFIFQVKEYPTFVFLDSNGRVVLKDNGSQSTANMMLLAETALDEYERIKAQAIPAGE